MVVVHPPPWQGALISSKYIIGADFLDLGFIHLGIVIIVGSLTMLLIFFPGEGGVILPKTFPYNPQLIKEHADILFQLINYRWTQKLEDIDGSPRIAKKIRGVDREETPKRASLTKFKTYLDTENPGRICFHSGRPIADDDIAIDHVIPWSYLYADNLWNLVYVDRTENSSKSNRIPNEATIERLESRNTTLLKMLKLQKNRNKHVAELEIAVERDYLKRFWIGCRG